MIENIPESLKDKLKDVDLSKLEQCIIDAKEAAKFDLTGNTMLRERIPLLIKMVRHVKTEVARASIECRPDRFDVDRAEWYEPFEVIKRIQKAHQGVKVTIICRTAEDEAKCKLLAQEAGLEVVEIIREDNEKLLPDGECVIVINPEGFSIYETAEKLTDAFDEAFNQSVDAEMQQIVHKIEFIDPAPIINSYERAYQREQMKQRSRYLSKHCRK